MDWHKVTANGSADRDPSQLRAPLLTAAYATWAVLLCLHLLHTLSGPWPAPLPRLRLDRMALSTNLHVLETGVFNEAGARDASDHLPIWARIRFP